MKQSIDISIDGQGFYSICGESQRGVLWVKRHVQGAAHGSVYCDDVNLTQDVAEAATKTGLRVTVNGYLYLAGGARGKKVAA